LDSPVEVSQKLNSFISIKKNCVVHIISKNYDPFFIQNPHCLMERGGEKSVLKDASMENNNRETGFRRKKCIKRLR
jgi:hypothetical protein